MSYVTRLTISTAILIAALGTVILSLWSSIDIPWFVYLTLIAVSSAWTMYIGHLHSREMEERREEAIESIRALINRQVKS